MASYDRCPTCGNTENGTTIYQCKNCGHIGCFKTSLFGGDEGCWRSSTCPACKDKTNPRSLGVIKK